MSSFRSKTFFYFPGTSKKVIPNDQKQIDVNTTAYRVGSPIDTMYDAWSNSRLQDSTRRRESREMYRDSERATSTPVQPLS